MENMANQGQLEKAMQQSGKSLVTRFFVLIKTAQNYAEGHAAITIPVEQLLAIIRSMHRMNAEAFLRLKGGHLYLADLRLKPDASGFEAFRFIMEEFNRCYLGSINLTPGVSVAEITGFIQILQSIQPPPSFQAFSELQRIMHSSGITHIELEAMTEETDYVISKDEARINAKSRARRIYFQAVSAVNEIMSSAEKGRPLRMAKAKRIVQGMVDQITTDSAELTCVTTLKDNERYSGHHPVNVCILSLILGLRIGLSKSMCCELGLAALCHDIGKSVLPKELLDKNSELSQEDWQKMFKHPLVGVKLLMELKQFDNLSARMMTGIFEHHLQHDFSGYPKLGYHKMGLFSKIISIADDYDALTSTRVYRRVAMAPYKVMRFMLTRAGKSYDPTIIKLFVGVVGLYPVGTVLLLKTNEIAVVVKNKFSPEHSDTPLAKLIATAAGEEIDGEVIDTADLSGSGLSILGVIDSAAIGINPAGFFV